MTINQRFIAGAVPVSMAALLMFGAPMAHAKDVFIAGTHGLGKSSAVSPGDYQFITGHPLGDNVLVQYPRELGPLVGTMPLDRSVRTGTAAALPLIVDGDRIVSVSQGGLVAEAVKQQAVANGIHDLTFVSFGDPTNRDGGVLTKIWLPTVPSVHSTTPEPEGYHQTTYAIEYDIVADAPDVSVIQNPLAWANAVAGGIYDHPTYSQAVVDKAETEGRTVTTHNQDGTHVLIKQPNLPLTRPLRQVEQTLTGQTRVTDAIDHALRPIINAGYTGQRTTSTADGNKFSPTTTVAGGTKKPAGKNVDTEKETASTSAVDESPAASSDADSADSPSADAA